MTAASVLDTMKNRHIGPPEVREKFGVGPDRVGDVLALMGDSIDNVPGVAGIGPKTASEMINKFGSLDALLAAAEAGDVPGKRGLAIDEAREAIRVSRDLVRLREDVPLPKTIEELHRIDPDKKQLRALFTELEFSRLADQLSASGAAAIAPHAENTPPPRRWCRRRSPRSRRRRRSPPSPSGWSWRRSRRDPRGRPSAWRRSTTVRRRCARPGRPGRGAGGDRRVYLPLCHRYLGAPSCLPRRRRWRRWRRCWRRGRSRSTSTTPRRWRCCSCAAG